MTAPDWLRVERGAGPLILAFPHGGTLIPPNLCARFVSPWQATRDADWHIGDLYAGLADATTVATAISRSVIDVNRDPSGTSLYPGQATTELCPSTTFDGDPLYRPDDAPNEADIAARRARWFDPYHAALAVEVARLRVLHDRVVVFDCHSIRSRIPRLFDGELPELNVGTNDGATCSPALSDAVAAACAASARTHVVNGRFKGGWTTRHYGHPGGGVHAIQMELAARAYLREPAAIDPGNWPPPYDPAFAAPLRATLSAILTSVLDFAKGPA
jgi:formiminoglutamase